MKKILIVYDSGAGSTRLISRAIQERLADGNDVSIEPAVPGFNPGKIDGKDLLIIGFPTYHCEPSRTILDFIRRVGTKLTGQRVFFFTSYGLYTGNCLRIFHSELNRFKAVSLGCSQFRSPASDGILMFSPKIRWLSEFETHLNENLNDFISSIRNCEKLPPSKIPPYKWYVPLNELAKIAAVRSYDRMKRKMHILKGSCTNCNHCVSVCTRNCWSKHDRYPRLNPEDCEFCLGCIHHCPNQAIVFSEKMKNKPRFNKSFFAQKYARMPDL